MNRLGNKSSSVRSPQRELEDVGIGAEVFWAETSEQACGAHENRDHCYVAHQPVEEVGIVTGEAEAWCVVVPRMIIFHEQPH